MTPGTAEEADGTEIVKMRRWGDEEKLSCFNRLHTSHTRAQSAIQKAAVSVNSLSGAKQGQNLHTKMLTQEAALPQAQIQVVSTNLHLYVSVCVFPKHTSAELQRVNNQYTPVLLQPLSLQIR